MTPGKPVLSDDLVRSMLLLKPQMLVTAGHWRKAITLASKPNMRQATNRAQLAARYLEECLPKSEYWDVPVAGQTEETTPARLLQFLEKYG